MGKSRLNSLSAYHVVMGLRVRLGLLSLVCLGIADAQVIEFESSGLIYRTLTRNGLTIMWASLPSHVKSYSIVQVVVSNGSKVPWVVKPQDFRFDRSDGVVLLPIPANTVIDSMLQRASRNDVIRLVTAYEAGLYGNFKLRSTDGYEARRQSALAEVASAKLKAAAAASAIAFVPVKVTPGMSTDGAIFFVNGGKPLGAGKLTVHAAGEVFEFEIPR